MIVAYCEKQVRKGGIFGWGTYGGSCRLWLSTFREEYLYMLFWYINVEAERDEMRCTIYANSILLDIQKV